MNLIKFINALYAAWFFLSDDVLATWESSADGSFITI